MSALEIANAQRKAKALRERIAGRRPGTKVAVDVRMLRTILRVVDAVVLHGIARRRTSGGVTAQLGHGVSAQQAKQRRWALDNLTALTEEYDLRGRGPIGD